MTKKKKIVLGSAFGIVLITVIVIVSLLISNALQRKKVERLAEDFLVYYEECCIVPEEILQDTSEIVEYKEKVYARFCDFFVSLDEASMLENYEIVCDYIDAQISGEKEVLKELNLEHEVKFVNISGNTATVTMYQKKDAQCGEQLKESESLYYIALVKKGKQWFIEKSEWTPVF